MDLVSEQNLLTLLFFPQSEALQSSLALQSPLALQTLPSSWFPCSCWLPQSLPWSFQRVYRRQNVYQLGNLDSSGMARAPFCQQPSLSESPTKPRLGLHGPSCFHNWVYQGTEWKFICGFFQRMTSKPHQRCDWSKSWHGLTSSWWRFSSAQVLLAFPFFSWSWTDEHVLASPQIKRDPKERIYSELVRCFLAVCHLSFWRSQQSDRSQNHNDDLSSSRILYKQSL